MNHPEVFFVPLLMFLDYFLTILGAIQKAKKYGDHFKFPHYELNPIWQKTIAKRKIFNLKHVLLTIGVSAYLIWAGNYAELPDDAVNGMLGCVITCLALVVGKHLSNLLIFGYLIRNPDAISGQVILSHHLMLIISIGQYTAVLFPLVLIAIYSNSSFACGSAAGACLIIFVHLIWLIKSKREMVRQKAKNAGC